MRTAKSSDYGQLQLDLAAANYMTDGAILIDEYDPIIFDDVLRESVIWNRLDKRLAPGETTGGFDQTAISTARSAARRSLAFTATSPTRTQRAGRTIKAITADQQFGIFDRSVYQQQGRRYGNLEAKDVQDLMVACIRHWNNLVYNGDIDSDANEFDGLKEILGAGTTVLASESILTALNDKLIEMTNNKNNAVRPTAIYTNARVVFMLNQELLKIGDRLLYAPIRVGPSVFECAQIATPVGFLPLIVDPFNSVVAGTPTTYPTFILSEDKLSWQYVEVLGAPGAEPKTFEIAQTNTLDIQFKTVMFGALETLQEGTHHARLNIQNRTTVVSPVG